MKWKLCGDLITGNDGKIYVIGEREWLFDMLPRQIVSILIMFAQGMSDLEYRKFESNKNVAHILHFLKDNKLLKPYKNDYKNTFLDRTYDYLWRKYGQVDEPLKITRDFKVAIIGCGGIGAGVGQHLARSGIRDFILIDGDCVEASNLNRQIPYDGRDIGKSKIEALKTHLENIDSDARVGSYNVWVNSMNDVSNIFRGDLPDLIVAAIDTPSLSSKLWLTQFARLKNIPIILGAVGIKEGVVGPLLYESTMYDHYISRLEKTIDKVNSEMLEPTRGSISSANSIIASYMTNLIVQYIYQKSKVQSDFYEKLVPV